MDKLTSNLFYRMLVSEYKKPNETSSEGEIKFTPTEPIPRRTLFDPSTNAVKEMLKSALDRVEPLYYDVAKSIIDSICNSIPYYKKCIERHKMNCYHINNNRVYFRIIINTTIEEIKLYPFGDDLVNVFNHGDVINLSFKDNSGLSSNVNGIININKNKTIIKVEDLYIDGNLYPLSTISYPLTIEYIKSN